MKQILILQSREHPETIVAEREEYTRAIGGLAELSFASTLDETLPWDHPEIFLQDYNGVIIGGSGEFDLHSEDKSHPKMIRARSILQRMGPLIAYFLENNYPTLGVCFGHQIIGEFMGGAVSTDASQKKAGSYEVFLTEEGQADRLFFRLPRSFVAQYGHRNSLTKQPRDSVLLAKSDICKFSALRFNSKVYTVQFHPELTSADVLRRFALTPGYLPDGVSAESLVRASPEASKIILLFIEHCIRAR